MATKVSITEILQDIRRKTNEPYRWDQVKWLLPLFYIHLALTVAFVLSVMGIVTASVYVTAEWLLHAAAAACLFCLTKAHSRFRPAAILLSVSLVISLLSAQVGAPPLLTTLSSLCVLISGIFEFSGHGKIAAQEDFQLAHRWNTLFLFSIAAMFAGAFAFFMTMMLSYLLQPDGMFLSLLTIVITYVPDLVVDILYLIYLHKTIRLVKQNHT